MSGPEKDPPPGPSSAAQYWGGNTDPQNLERAEGVAPRISLEDEIRFAQTPDFLAAAEWLDGAAASRLKGWTMDLGAGLGAQSIAFARRGEMVLAVDTSVARLRELRQRARAAGVAEGGIVCVVAAAESLPFGGDSLPRIFTKSVLIHTDLPRAATELHRVLSPGGRGALVEPQPGNPFAAMYRRWLAPKAWASITRYFDPEAQRVFLNCFRARNADEAVRPFYLFSFLAFAFEYGWPSPALFRIALAPLGLLDGLLFRLFPVLRRLAWFGVIRLEKHDSTRH